MKYAILASGSSGNASLVWTERRCLVVEAGIPMRRMLEMKRAAGCILKPDAILISHDHADHSGYAAEASRYWHCPILCSRECYDAAGFENPYDVRVFELGERFELPLWEFLVQSVPIPHTQGATGFVIHGGVDWRDAPLNLGIFTDLGSVTDEIRAAARQCHLLAIEANYSARMMAENPEYGEMLKKRLMAGYGHLSNAAVEEFFASQEWPNLHTVALIHLSHNNNLPALAVAAARRGLKCDDDMRIECAWNTFPIVMEV